MAGATDHGNTFKKKIVLKNAAHLNPSGQRKGAIKLGNRPGGKKKKSNKYIFAIHTITTRLM